LKTRILEIVRPTFPTCSALADVTDAWLSNQAPGILVAKLIADVAPTGLTIRQRGKLGFRAAVDSMTMDDVRSHLAIIRDPSFDPRNYSRKGYLLSGSIRTDGLRLQLGAFKLKELQSVRYRRLPDTILPPRLTSTVGGTDYYLQEIRNVVKTKDDVTRLWPHCSPKDIKVLCLDLGQAYVVAGSAFLPDSKDIKGKGPAFELRITSTPPNATETGSPSSSVDTPYPKTFYNVSVNQKAVYQPVFKFRRWSEERKQEMLQVQTSLSKISRRISHLFVGQIEAWHSMYRTSRRLESTWTISTTARTDYTKVMHGTHNARKRRNT